MEVLATDTVLAPGAGEEDAGVTRALRWYWRDHAWPRVGWRERVAIERHDARLVRERDADVVMWWAMGGLPMSLLAAARTPAVAVVLDGWPVYGPQVDPGHVRGRPLRARGVREWLFISETARARARATPWRLRRTSLAPCGIDPMFARAAPERPWSWRLLYAGRIDQAKGVDTAIAALEHLPAAASLTVSGRGDDALEARLRAAAGDRVRFTRDARADLPGVYADHDAVLFPVRWPEPWGLVPLEAMGRGRPVVATGLGGSGEYLCDGENCLLAGPDDPAAFAAAVRRLAGDPALRATLRAGGAATAARYPAARFHAAVLAAVERAARS